MQKTSVEAYYSLKNKVTKKQQVYDTLMLIEPACNLEVAKKLGWDINRVTPRMNELVKENRVEESDRHKTALTGKKVIYWMIKDIKE